VHVLLPPDRHVDAARRILESGRHALVAVSAACGTRLRARPTPIWKFYLGTCSRSW
jgi:hypothetical protein